MGLGILETARRAGVAKGVFGDSRPWLVVGGLAWGLKALQWALKPPAQTVLVEALEPGETIVISHGGPPPTRRQRRKARKLSKRVARDERRDRKELARARRRS